MAKWDIVLLVFFFLRVCVCGAVKGIETNRSIDVSIDEWQQQHKKKNLQNAKYDHVFVRILYMAFFFPFLHRRRHRWNEHTYANYNAIVTVDALEKKV